MTFTYDITADIGKIRMEVGDRTSGVGVRPDGSNFSDEEITGLLTEIGSVKGTAARLLEILSREWAKLSDMQLGPRREHFSQVSKQYATLANELREQVGSDTLSASVGLKRHDGYSFGHHDEEFGEYAPSYRHRNRYRGI